MKLAGCCLAALLMASGAAFAQALDAAQFKATFIGKSGTWASKDGKLKGTTSWTADKQSVTGNFPGFSEDTATWTMKNNNYCNKFTKIREGKEACQTVKKIGDKVYEFGDSSVVTLN